MIYALIGGITMFGILTAIGITQPRGTSVAVWSLFYVIIAVVFDALVVVALIYQFSNLIELNLGLSAGAATGLAIHTAHHVLEERSHSKTSQNKID